MPFHSMIYLSVHENLLKNTTSIDFKRYTWVTLSLKDQSQFYLNGSTLNDCSTQVEENTERPLGLGKG